MSSSSRDITDYSLSIIRDCDSDDDAPEEWATSVMSNKLFTPDFSKMHFTDENSIIITCFLVNETTPQVPIHFSITGNRFISYLIDNYEVDDDKIDSLGQIMEDLILKFEEQHDITHSSYSREDLYACLFGTDEDQNDDDLFYVKRHSVYRFSDGFHNYCLLFSLNYSQIQINADTYFNF